MIRSSAFRRILRVMSPGGSRAPCPRLVVRACADTRARTDKGAGGSEGARARGDHGTGSETCHILVNPLLGVTRPENKIARPENKILSTCQSQRQRDGAVRPGHRGRAVGVGAPGACGLRSRHLTGDLRPRSGEVSCPWARSGWGVAGPDRSPRIVHAHQVKPVSESRAVKMRCR